MWKWLKENPHMWKATKLQDMGLGVEPDWVRSKRLEEMQTPNDGKRWTAREKEEAFKMRQRGMTYEEVAKALGRKPKGTQTALERYVHVKMGKVVNYGKKTCDGQTSSRKETHDTAEDSRENEGTCTTGVQHRGIGEHLPCIRTDSQAVSERT
jgi:predicted transcriptional regulator